MRIVHFSDIHAACWISGFRGYFNKRILGSFNYLIRRKFFHNWSLVDLAVARIKQLSPDVVVCSGDLATISEKREFNLAREALSPLINDHAFEFIYVPGNHDYYLNSAECKALLEDTFFYMNRNRFKLSDLPLSFDIKNVRFLLVNEAKPTPLFLSSGAIDKKTQNWITAQLEPKQTACIRTVLVGHYPLFDEKGRDLPKRRRCWNNSLFQKALRNGSINISLCGHIHESFVRWENSDSLEVCAGSLTKNGTVNVITFDSGHDKINQRWVSVVSSVT